MNLRAFLGRFVPDSVSSSLIAVHDAVSTPVPDTVAVELNRRPRDWCWKNHLAPWQQLQQNARETAQKTGKKRRVNHRLADAIRKARRHVNRARKREAANAAPPMDAPPEADAPFGDDVQHGGLLLEDNPDDDHRDGSESSERKVIEWPDDSYAYTAATIVDDGARHVAVARTGRAVGHESGLRATAPPRTSHGHM